MKGDPKIAYATMMEIRKFISCAFTKIYSSAITIATRYSVFRRQFKDSTKQQITVMDYQLQQEKIIERVAEYYAVTVLETTLETFATKTLNSWYKSKTLV